MHVTLSTSVPLQADLKHDGIPNWTTRAPHTAGTLQTGPRGLPPMSFVLSDANVGPRNLYASAQAAIDAMRKHATQQAIAIVHDTKLGGYSGHEVWTYTQRQGEANTRLAGATITSFSPMQTSSSGGFSGFSSPFEGLVAIVAGTRLLTPH